MKSVSDSDEELETNVVRFAVNVAFICSATYVDVSSR
jgi:hypothetical protein